MVYQYQAKRTTREARNKWLEIGQKVKIVADKHHGKNGTVTAVDHRFRRPYSVKVILDSSRTRNIHYAANELRITRF